MRLNAPKFAPLFAACLATALVPALTACGGGGGSADAPAPPPVAGGPAPAPAPAPAPPPVAVDHSLQTTLTTPTYTGDQLVAWNELQAIRAAIGVGYLNQSSGLDTSATDHATYLGENPFVDAHNEIVGHPGFTGVSSSNRCVPQGYPDGCSEAVAIGYPSDAASIYALFASYPHSFVLMSSERDVGFGTSGTDFDLDFGTVSGNLQAPSSTTFVANYPYEGQIGVLRDGFPDGVGGLTSIGHPITAWLPGNDVTATTTTTLVAFTLKDGNGNLVPTEIIGASAQTSPVVIASSTLGEALTGSQTALIPLSPLTANTTYTATITFTNPTATKTWSFTTGAI